MDKRDVDVVVLSDIHLGTYGCHAKELIRYMRSIRPKTVILNGDIVDIWQFSKSYWPKSHMKVLKEFVKWMSQGIPVYYITGNHDDTLRKFSDFQMSNFYLKDKLLLELDGKKAWIFHGDIFDLSVKHARWLAKLGGKGYEALIILNRGLNWGLTSIGQPKFSFSKKIKSSVKKAVQFVSDFEQAATSLAIKNGYDYVICGHIHQPQMREIKTEEGSVIYLNSGDWIENLTSLEYVGGKWSIHHHEESEYDDKAEDDDIMEKDMALSILQSSLKAS